jgi:hypothetical protein
MSRFAFGLTWRRTKAVCKHIETACSGIKDGTGGAPVEVVVMTAQADLLEIAHALTPIVCVKG